MHISPPLNKAMLAAVAAMALLASCSTYVDSRVQGLVLEALPKVLGEAEAYDVRVGGTSADGSCLTTLQVQGIRVARANMPVIQQLTLDMQGVRLDRRLKQLTAVHAVRAHVSLLPADLADHLRKSGWLDNAQVHFDPPDRLRISGLPRIPGLPFPSRGGIEFRGRVLARGSQLHVTVDTLRLGEMQAPVLLRALLETAINPLLDISGHVFPSTLDSVSMTGTALTLTASGSHLPSAGPTCQS